MIVGGWEYIWGAYGLVWTVLGLYGLALWRRSRKPPDHEAQS